jgi:hypothetical protein
MLRHRFLIDLGLALPAFDALIHVVRVLRDHRCVRNVAFVAAVGRDEDVEPAWDHEAPEEEQEYDVAHSKAHDVKRIGLSSKGRAGIDEVGVGERVDDCKNGAGDIFYQGSPDDGNVPVFAGADDDVKVTAELLALWKWLVQEFGSSARLHSPSRKRDRRIWPTRRWSQRSRVHVRRVFWRAP